MDSATGTWRVAEGGADALGQRAGLESNFQFHDVGDFEDKGRPTQVAAPIGLLLR